MVKFTPPEGYHFMPDGTLMAGPASHAGSSTYKWTKVVSIYTDGKTNTTTGLGPITLNDKIPNGAILSEIKPKFVRTLTALTKVEMINQIFSYKTFGLRYDRNTKQWKIILQDDLNLVNNFSTSAAGDTTSKSLDSSWILLFETNGTTYDVSYRSLRYIFESYNEVKFFFDQNKKIYDSKTGKLIKDTISVLSINNDVNASTNTLAYTTDFNWEISKSFYNDDGYINNKKLEITFSDSDDDGECLIGSYFHEVWLRGSVRDHGDGVRREQSEYWQRAQHDPMGSMRCHGHRRYRKLHHRCGTRWFSKHDSSVQLGPEPTI
jgi:hypothetical protein